ncbi:polyprenyl synthetase family protein [Candidatus Microgenomates bacterium]|nr:polyprenyl synthetase family protein [Candidatus Microgenomates bacterium]
MLQENLTGNGPERWLVPENGSLQDFLTSYDVLAERQLADFLIERKREALDSPFINAMYEHAEFLLRGGKKMRGALIALGFSSIQREEEYHKSVVDFSLGYEALHNAFLVHDDIMDRSPLRRGKPTAHRFFQGLTSDPKRIHFGQSSAINLGDMMAFWVLGTLAKGNFPQNRVSDTLDTLSAAVSSTVEGQMLDLVPTKSLSELTEEQVLSIAERKTALYSFVAPLQLGAILGGIDKSDPRLAAMREFGTRVGIAFQIQDDLLGVYGNEKELGKSITSDLAEGKKTLFFLELYRRLESFDRLHLSSLWGRTNVGRRDVAWVRERGRWTRTLEDVQQFSRSLIEEVKGAIPRISEDPRIQSVLSEVADFSVERTY